jgi:hypothetical protein
MANYYPPDRNGLPQNYGPMPQEQQQGGYPPPQGYLPDGSIKAVGILLGFFLGLLGVLIHWLIYKNKGLVKYMRWSVIGMGINFAIACILTTLIFGGLFAIGTNPEFKDLIDKAESSYATRTDDKEYIEYDDDLETEVAQTVNAALTIGLDDNMGTDNDSNNDGKLDKQMLLSIFNNNDFKYDLSVFLYAYETAVSKWADDFQINNKNQTIFDMQAVYILCNHMTETYKIDYEETNPSLFKAIANVGSAWEQGAEAFLSEDENATDKFFDNIDKAGKEITDILAGGVITSL